MVVLLPEQVDGLSDLEKRLSVDTLKKWTSGLNVPTVDVVLPKFKMTSSFRLKRSWGRWGWTLRFRSMPISPA